MKNNDRAETAKQEWETPTMTVVASTREIAGAVGNDDDEDFDGFPVPS